MGEHAARGDAWHRHALPPLHASAARSFLLPRRVLQPRLADRRAAGGGRRSRESQAADMAGEFAWGMVGGARGLCCTGMGDGPRPRLLWPHQLSSPCACLPLHQPQLRLHMALDAAKGMLALHQHSPPIVHRDLKGWVGAQRSQGCAPVVDDPLTPGAATAAGGDCKRGSLLRCSRSATCPQLSAAIPCPALLPPPLARPSRPNLLVDFSWRVKVADFNLSKVGRNVH